MLDSEIYVKTDAGRDEIRSRALGLPMSVRAILLMIDGQRSVSAMRALIAGSKAPASVLEDLVAQGLIESRAGAGPTPESTAPTPQPVAVAPPAAPSIVASPAPIARPAVSDTVAAAMRALDAPSASPARSFDVPLDLVLPTIHGPTIHEAAPTDAPEAAPSPPSDVVPPNRYEHLYAMMNEIVRDFLAPHRRYFFQLKIERCGTAEELLELLHGLQTALAKSRGEAFASDVIARLRSAAA